MIDKNIQFPQQNRRQKSKCCNTYGEIRANSLYLPPSHVHYNSGSQPFGLQVPVKDKFSSYCPGQNFFLSIVSQQYLFFFLPPEHKMDADITWIIIQIHFQPNKFKDISYIMLK